MQQQQGGTASTASTRRRLSVPRNTAAAAAGAGASVWETRMRMDEVKGGVKVFSAGGDDADEEGLRVYQRLRRNQSEGGGGTGTAASVAKKRRNWKASEPVTAIGELRKSRSDMAAAGVVARRAVARMSTPEKKVAAAGGEVKEVVVVEVEKAPLEESKNFEEETEEDDEDEELEEELEAEEVEEKDVLDQDHMAIDEEQTVQSTALHQVDDQDLEPPTKRGIKPVTAPVEDERATNPEPVKTPPEKKLATAVDLRAINPEPMTPPPVEKKPTPVVIRRMTNAEPARPSPEKKASPAIGRRIPKQEPDNTPRVEEYEEIQGRPSAATRSNGRMQNIVDLVMWRDVSKSALVFGLGTFLLISSSYAKDLNFNTITAASYLSLVYLGLRFLCKSILNRGESVECGDGSNGERYLVGEEEAIWLLRLVLPYINEVLLNLRSLFSGEPATTMKLALLLFAMARCGSFVTLWTLAKLVFFGVFIIPKVCSSYSAQLARYVYQTREADTWDRIRYTASTHPGWPVKLILRAYPPIQDEGVFLHPLIQAASTHTGTFWLERFRDAWESCSHKKAVVAAVFTLVWNVSSTVARVWAVFMLVVAMKCYQQRMMEYGWSSTVKEAPQEADDESQQEETPVKPGPAKANDQEAQGFGAAAPRHRRTPVSGEFAGERLRVRGGIQPR